MNILNISTFDTGGAGSYAVLMNEMFNNYGFASQLVVRYSESAEKNIIPVDYIAKEGSLDFELKKTKRFLYKKMNGISRKRLQTKFDYYFFQDEQDEYISASKILGSIAFKPDIIFLYWISEFITSKTIRELYERTGAHIYWMMTDNAPITGGCHYPWDCKGFTNDCSNCPAITEKKFSHKAVENLALKQEKLPENLSIIAGSEQDYQRAKSSSLSHSRTIIKQLGFVNENKFKPGNMALAKIHFDISPEQRVLFFGASKMNEKRKGMDLLVKAFMQLKEFFAKNQVILLYAGQQMPDFADLAFQNAGFLNEDELILAYQAADIFVCPSIEDSGPIMINQSIMCGTPVVAFETGVALDLVLNGQTGYRAKVNDLIAFSEGIRKILELPQSLKKRYSEKCREKGIANYGKPAFREFCDEILL